MLLAGVAESYASTDAPVKISQNLEMDRRKYESLPASQSRAKSRIKAEIEDLEWVQDDLAKVKRHLLVALDRQETRLFQHKTHDWTRVVSSFAYWVGREGSSWIKVSMGTYDQQNEQYSPWRLQTFNYDHFRISQTGSRSNFRERIFKYGYMKDGSNAGTVFTFISVRKKVKIHHNIHSGQTCFIMCQLDEYGDGK